VSDATPARRAGLVGTGLIGASVGLALRRAGWHVTATDRDEALLARAVAAGVADEAGVDDRAELTFVAVPVGSIPRRRLRRSTPVGS